jgi:hypothetical protein
MAIGAQRGDVMTPEVREMWVALAQACPTFERALIQQSSALGFGR